MLKDIIKKLNITELELFYEGNHNKTYRGVFCDFLVQIRISKNNIVNHGNEILLLKNKRDVFYVDKQILVRKWIQGKTLDTNDINILIKIKKALVKHWNTKINNITNFNDSNIINDVILSHGDLRRKNIIINENNDIDLIDFEWVNYNSKYFDLAHLHLYCLFSIKDIIKVFNINKEELIKEIKIVNEFNNKWEKLKYIVDN